METTAYATTTTQKATLAMGVILALVGIIGFFQDPVFGIFDVDTIHNIVHLLTGALAIIFSYSPMYARRFMQGAGIVYALVFIIGLIQKDTVLGIFDINGADNWLHLGLTLIFLYFGFRSERGYSRS